MSDKTKSSGRSGLSTTYTVSENGRTNDRNFTPSGTSDTPDTPQISASGSPRPANGQGGMTRGQSMDAVLVSDEDDRVSARKSFILTCLCFCVGFSNVMRFPLKVYIHGSSFILAYVVMVFLIGLPSIYFEVGLGQFTGSGPIAFWGFSPLFQGVGVAIVITDTLDAVGYNQFTAYCLFYMLTSIGWSSGKRNKCNVNSSGSSNQTLSFSHFVAYNYYEDNIGDIDAHFNWKVFLCLIGSWVLVGSYILMGQSKRLFGPVMFTVFIGAYAIIIALLAHSSSLEGSYDGVVEYMRPKFESLLTWKIWEDAAVETLFSFYLQGMFAVLASYNNIHCEFFGDVIILAFLELLSNVLPGFVVFSYLGVLSKQCGSKVFNFTAHKHDLEVAYLIIPSVVRTTNDPAVWGFLFFLMLYILTMTTQIVIVQTVITAIKDRYPALGVLNFYVIFFVCLILFCCAIPFNRREGIDMFWVWSEHTTGLHSMFLQVVGFIALAWVYGADNFLDDIQFMRGTQHILKCIPWWYMRIFLFFTWKYITPTILISLIIASLASENPFKHEEKLRLTVMKMAIQLLPIGVFVLSVIVKICRSEGSLIQRIASKARPAESWGPAHPKKLTNWKKKKHTMAPLAENEKTRASLNISVHEDGGCDAIDTVAIVAENNN